MECPRWTRPQLFSVKRNLIKFVYSALFSIALSQYWKFVSVHIAHWAICHNYAPNHLFILERGVGAETVIGQVILCPLGKRFYEKKILAFGKQRERQFSSTPQCRIENLITYSEQYFSSDQEFRREGWTETAVILCKLNKSL